MTTVLVTDTGFAAADAATAMEPGSIVIASTCDPAGLAALMAAPAICITVDSFADGRGFTLARRLRILGYEGRLRLAGPVIADQYAMARRAGFDELEIPADLAARQPQDQWLARANWQDHDHQSRLRA